VGRCAGRHLQDVRGGFRGKATEPRPELPLGTATSSNVECNAARHGPRRRARRRRAARGGDILRFKDAREEASHLADAISIWIDNDAIEPSEIAVLISKQQNLRCQELRAALTARKVPFREEDQPQDLASEPVVRLITDFLLVVSGSAQPEAYRRWLDAIVYSEALDDEQEYRAHSQWERCVVSARQHLSRLRRIFRHAQIRSVDRVLGVSRPHAWSQIAAIVVPAGVRVNPATRLTLVDAEASSIIPIKGASRMARPDPCQLRRPCCHMVTWRFPKC
jgi:hypothetical protein